MFKNIFLLFLLFSSCLCNLSFAENISNRFNYIPKNTYYSDNFSDISALEKYSMNKSYTRDNLISRLERLEQVAFGAIQIGDINQRYQNVKTAILSRPQNNHKNSLLRTFSNYFNGQMTGYSPMINSYNYVPQNRHFYTPYNSAYMPNYNYYPNNVGHQSFVRTNSPFSNGYRLNNSSIGNNCGVRILD